MSKVSELLHDIVAALPVHEKHKAELHEKVDSLKASSEEEKASPPE